MYHGNHGSIIRSSHGNGTQLNKSFKVNKYFKSTKWMIIFLLFILSMVSTVANYKINGKGHISLDFTQG